MELAQVQQLQTPSAFPHPVSSIRLVETPSSWVLVTHALTYKIKRPIKTYFLDFSTLDLRKSCCERELALNQRTAKEVYLEVVPVVQTSSGLRFGGDGPVVDFSVKMMTLPAHQEMRTLLHKNQVTSSQIRKLGEEIAQFHQMATSISISAYDYASHLIPLIDEPRLQVGLLEREFSLGSRLERLLAVLHTLKPILFDCIDYNDEYRFIDPLLDLAFLVVELESLGRWDLASMLVESYGYHQTDPHLSLLLPFHKSLRANVFLILQARAFEETTDLPKRREGRNRIFSLFSLSESYLKGV